MCNTEYTECAHPIEVVLRDGRVGTVSGYRLDGARWEFVPESIFESPTDIPVSAIVCIMPIPCGETWLDVTQLPHDFPDAGYMRRATS